MKILRSEELRGRRVVYGGTFDPFGHNHVAVVRHLLELGAKVVIAPTQQNPFKTTEARDFLLRFNLIYLVCTYEEIPLVPFPNEEGVVLETFRYQRSREFVEYWRDTYEEPVVWSIGPDLVDEVPRWSDGWVAENVEIYVTPDFPLPHARDVREGRAPFHPAIAALVEKHGHYR